MFILILLIYSKKILMYQMCFSNRNYENNVATTSTLSADYGQSNPLAHLSESVNAIDPLNAMEKSLNEVIY